MKVVIQRVKKANVKINGKVKDEILKGMLVLVGISENDDQKTLEWMYNKIINLRIFDDENGVMNKSVLDTKGQIMLISNFTLYADSTRGYRPSYSKAAKPEFAIGVFNDFVELFKKSEVKIAEGEFGAMMDIELINDGPVTIIIEK